MKKTKYWVWLALTLPAVWILARYLRDSISYGEVIHITGDWSVGLLFAALAVTPLRRVLPKAALPKWLLFHRRAIGVASFGYAAFHTVAYLEKKWGYGYIIPEGMKPELLTGWIALLIFLILAITSNNQSIRLLRKKWQHLHRTVYLAAGLTFAHWILTAFEPQTAYICLVALLAVEALRLYKKRGSTPET